MATAAEPEIEYVVFKHPFIICFNFIKLDIDVASHNTAVIVVVSQWFDVRLCLAKVAADGDIRVTYVECSFTADSGTTSCVFLANTAFDQPPCPPVGVLPLQAAAAAMCSACQA